MAEILTVIYVFCYLLSVKNIAHKDSIVLINVAFYTSDACLKAKKNCFVEFARKQNNKESVYQPLETEPEDIKDYLDLIGRKPTNAELLMFKVQGHTSLPPVCVDIIASVIITLIDKVSELRVELN